MITPLIRRSTLLTAALFTRSHSTTMPFPVSPYHPKHTSWPYTPTDFTRYDETTDDQFYSMARIGVTHIDDHAIDRLYDYYAQVLPDNGRVLDLCSSWISFIPKEKAQLEVVGLGMNARELEANSKLVNRIVQDLNLDPTIPPSHDGYEAAMCVVSIDYLNKPVQVLSSLKERMVRGGKVHLVISNRCFPTKVIKRWLEISEEERLKMVGDYLHFAGYEGIEIVTLSDGWAEGSRGRMRVDPLWVVRGTAGA